MATRTLRKIQRNFMVTLPSAFRKTFTLSEGDWVEIEQTDNAIVIRPVEIRRKQVLDRLETAMEQPVAGPLNSMSEEDVLREVEEEIRVTRSGRRPKR